ncbi:hypothetical protein ACFY1J_31190 [Streptomyces sp. NPDC001406]|uniref:hypothetical protein n=1 Tax=Streptomyces sp. NPDC001406 TaxID=3364572 RepID=UPI0036CD1C8A
MAEPLSRAVLAQIRAGVERNPGTPSARTIRLLLDELDRWRPVQQTPFPLDGIYLDVLVCSANGQNVVQTAHALHVAPDAVRSRRKRIRDRLNVASMEQAVAVAIRQGWLPLGEIEIPSGCTHHTRDLIRTPGGAA